MRPGVDTLIERSPTLAIGDENQVHAVGGHPKARFLWVLPLAIHATRFVVHNSSGVNARRALYERVFNVEGPEGLEPTPRPVPGAFTRLNEFKRQLLRRLPKFPAVSYDTFVERYTGRRRTIYAKAALDCIISGVRESHAYMSSFIKAEKVKVTDSKPDPAPRLIQPRHPMYNVEVGRRISHMEKPLYRAIADLYGGPTVMKGYNAHATAAHLRDMWCEFKDPVAVGLDASRFDQHVSVDALRWEHSVYCSLTPSSERPSLSKLLSWQLENHGFLRTPDQLLKYRVNGCRMSGDMNTAMGNCLIMCALVWQWGREHNVKLRLANNGDDCVVIFERRELAHIPGMSSWFLEYGFNMKIEEPVDVFERIEFCQTQPINVGGTWLMCRNPRVCIDKDSCSTLDLSNETARFGWATAVGDCGMSIAGGVPVLQSFYKAMQKFGGGIRIGHTLQHDSGFFRLASGMDREESEISDDTRFSFFLAFGVTPSAQLELERYYDNAQYARFVARREISPPISNTSHLLSC